ncbi:MAG: MBL fold metallo-hydrolase [Capsulimonadales bacterium]|nr:MBL fold metallo-hydrolase [Capsulimonadales bacterium]
MTGFAGNAYNFDMPSANAHYHSRTPLSPDALEVTVLGAGTSTGVPVIGCDCSVCRSSDPFNKRLRPSILVRSLRRDGTSTNILVDTSPDLRTQALRASIDRVDAVLITHAHADHIFGMDDLRQFNFVNRSRIPVYGTPDVLNHLRTVFAYCFTQTQEGGGKPQLDLIEITPGESFEIGGVSIRPLSVWHGTVPVTAYKFGARFAYVTDVSAIPEETMGNLSDLDTLILDAVRPDPHPTHFGLQQAMDIVTAVRAERAYFNHLSHHFDYETTMRNLPAGMELAYDGLTFLIPGE